MKGGATLANLAKTGAIAGGVGGGAYAIETVKEVKESDRHLQEVVKGLRDDKEELEKLRENEKIRVEVLSNLKETYRTQNESLWDMIKSLKEEGDNIKKLHHRLQTGWRREREKWEVERRRLEESHIALVNEWKADEEMWKEELIKYEEGRKKDEYAIEVLRRDKDLLKNLFEKVKKRGQDTQQLAEDLLKFIIKKELSDCPKSLGQKQVEACILQIAFGSES